MAGRGREAAFDYAALDYNEIMYCRVSLAKDWKKELVGTMRERERNVLLRHKRDARTPAKDITLAPGKTIRLPLNIAESFFGMFSIPVLDRASRAKTEGEKKVLAQYYAMTRAHAIVRWGDFPRLARAGSGMTYEPLGPARFPDVTVAIEPTELEDLDPNDMRYKPHRLRTLYDLGDFVDMEHLVNPGGWQQREHDAKAQREATAAESELREELARIRATNDVLMGLLGPGVQAKVDAILATSESAPKAKEPAKAGA